jgi:hypothetical protein
MGADLACLEGTATLRLAGKANYHTVSALKPLQQPAPPIYALGTSREASYFPARNHVGLGESFGPFDAMGKVTGFYKEVCERFTLRRAAQARDDFAQVMNERKHPAEAAE